MHTLTVLGLPHGTRVLSSLAKEEYGAADVVAAFPGTLTKLDLAAAKNGERTILTLETPLAASLERLQSLVQQGKRILVLTFGDPLFFGLGASLSRFFPKETLRILPSVSALQEACARLALPWHDVRCLSLHGRHDRTSLERLNQALMSGKTLCILTDPQWTPVRLAAYLQEQRYEAIMHIFHALGEAAEDYERLSVGADRSLPAERSTQSTVILEPQNEKRPVFGMPDAFFRTGNGYSSSQCVRAMALSLLALSPTDIVWDIGSGSGALALEASRLLPDGALYAVEEDADRCSAIRERVRSLGAYVVNAVHGHAPDCLDDLPDPDGIFLGGGLAGTDACGLLDVLSRRLRARGRLVVSTILTASFATVTAFLSKKRWPNTSFLISSAETKPLANDTYFSASNPVHLTLAEKTGG